MIQKQKNLKCKLNLKNNNNIYFIKISHILNINEKTKINNVNKY